MCQATRPQSLADALLEDYATKSDFGSDDYATMTELKIEKRVVADVF